ncbi:hypothetical protein V6N13_060616 [Hibiscus sabdariffa]|uniref:Uncharacterized protein n=1 Tax=Hibiscus sabdariffa TaxID=183260 RepID=A0ABR2P796_9ROSI
MSQSHCLCKWAGSNPSSPRSRSSGSAYTPLRRTVRRSTPFLSMHTLVCVQLPFRFFLSFTNAIGVLTRWTDLRFRVGRGIYILYEDVKSCPCEDVHVLWSILMESNASSLPAKH